MAGAEKNKTIEIPLLISVTKWPLGKDGKPRAIVSNEYLARCPCCQEILMISATAKRKSQQEKFTFKPEDGTGVGQKK